MASRYICEKLSVAMECLAVSAAPIQARLANAGMSALIRLKPDDFDDEDERRLFDSIMATLRTAEPIGAQGSIERSAMALTDEQAVAVARQIANLHGRVMPLW